MSHLRRVQCVNDRNQHGIYIVAVSLVIWGTIALILAISSGNNHSCDRAAKLDFVPFR